MEQVGEQGGFAGAHFTGNDPETLVFADGIFKVGIGVLMAAAPENVGWVGIEIERFFLQAVEDFVHGWLFHLVEDRAQDWLAGQ